MTAKPVLFVANVAEEDLQGNGALVQQVRQYAAEHGGTSCRSVRGWRPSWRSWMKLIVQKCCILWGSPNLVSDRSPEPRTGRWACKAISRPEKRRSVRGPFRSARTAPQAAGVIHSDFERGFIRCEVYTLDDLETYKSEKEIRAAGRLRVEGKSYVMQDGDICHFLFNV
jgi:hypothetical protein